MSQHKRYWLGFNLVRGIGAGSNALLEHFGDAEAAWKGTPEELRAAGLGQKTVARLVALREDVDLDLLWRRAEEQGINILTSEDDGYPRRLREIDQPPPVLFVRGDWRAEDEIAVAIVGTAGSSVRPPGCRAIYGQLAASGVLNQWSGAGR
jgi:DNA processing protein